MKELKKEKLEIKEKRGAVVEPMVDMGVELSELF